jgi:PST family polysaccharide transporter
MGQLLTFGRQLLGSRVAIYLPTNIDNVVIGATAGAFAVGLYSRAYQLVSMPLNYVSSPLMRVALPVLAQAAGSEEFERLTLRFQMLICYVSGTIFAVLAGLAEPLTLLLFGPSWEAAAPLVMLLALGGIFRALTVLCDWTLQAKGSTATQFRYTAIAAPIWVVAIAASAIGGAAAVAVATSTAAALFWVVYIRAATKSLSFTPGRMLRHSLARLAALPLPIFMTTWLTAQSSYGPVAQVLLGSGIALAAGACLAACVPMVRRDLRSVRRRRLSRTEHSSAAASDQRQER